MLKKTLCCQRRLPPPAEHNPARVRMIGLDCQIVGCPNNFQMRYRRFSLLSFQLFVQYLAFAPSPCTLPKTPI